MVVGLSNALNLAHLDLIAVMLDLVIMATQELQVPGSIGSSLSQIARAVELNDRITAILGMFHSNEPFLVVSLSVDIPR